MRKRNKTIRKRLHIASPRNKELNKDNEPIKHDKKMLERRLSTILLTVLKSQEGGNYCLALDASYAPFTAYAAQPYERGKADQGTLL